MGEALEKAVPLLVKAGAYAGPRGLAGALLFEACWGNRYDVVQLLLDRGVDVNGRFGDAMFGEDGRTALFSVAGGGPHDVVELLLNHWADITAKDVSYDTVLMAAINGRNSRRPLETIKRLLKLSVDVNAQNSVGDTGLHLLHISNYTYKKKRIIAKLLLEKGIYPLENVAVVQSSILTFVTSYGI
ncbi:hypothetical protein DL769_006425 [Monosporascus sp. CRB-8-3]|nr:hypothetical protein DL769_006425 [Monosporascus sp. CRB-8-3]